MKQLYTLIAVGLLSVASLSAFAENKPMKMQMDMGSMSEEMKDKQARKKQQYILQIDELSSQIRHEKNTRKKKKLMDKQLQLIKDHQEAHRQMKKKMMQKHMQKMMRQKKAMQM